MFLSLLEKWAQGFGNVGQPEVHRLAEPIPVSLKLSLFKAKVSGESVTTAPWLNCEVPMWQVFHLGMRSARRGSEHGSVPARGGP